MTDSSLRGFILLDFIVYLNYWSFKPSSQMVIIKTYRQDLAQGTKRQVADEARL